MAEEQKNSSAETVDAAASAAHTVKGAIVVVTHLHKLLPV